MKNQDKEAKWARIQVDPADEARYQRSESTMKGDYNIWYHKYMGENDRDRDAASHRCNSLKDSGMTKANLVESRERVPLCQFFAKGCCSRGPECTYYHRIPTFEDERTLDHLHDVFGRERFGSDKEDMTGVGNYNRDCRTLYIGNLTFSSGNVREILAKAFCEWGEVVALDVKPKISCAFVRYKYRVSAEFAKVAMGDQLLDFDEPIVVKWAYDDPNPVAIKRVKLEKEERFDQRMEELKQLSTTDVYQQALLASQDSNSQGPIHYEPPQQTALNIAEISNPNKQTVQEAIGKYQQQQQIAQQQQYYQQYYQQYLDQNQNKNNLTNNPQ